MPTVLAIALAVIAAAAPAARAADTAVERTRRIVDEVRAASYPELRGADIQVRAFESRSDYFRSRFDYRRYLAPTSMRYVVFVNPRVYRLGAPDDAVRAIVAHELAHVLFYRQRSRLHLLGLVRLSGSGYRQRFERRADLVALSRGYGDGLKAYRAWLYAHVPAKSLDEKRRDYFSPDEIAAIAAAAKDRPELYGAMMERVPRNLAEVRAAAGGEVK
jgi:hypothetical protein